MIDASKRIALFSAGSQSKCTMRGAGCCKRERKD